MVVGEDGRRSIEWVGDSRWLQVSIGLLGQAGAMRALGPTLKLPDQVSAPALGGDEFHSPFFILHSSFRRIWSPECMVHILP